MALSWVGATVPDVARPDVTSCCGSQHIVTALQLSRALTREKALSQASAHVGKQVEDSGLVKSLELDDHEVLSPPQLRLLATVQLAVILAFLLLRAGWWPPADTDGAPGANLSVLLRPAVAGSPAVTRGRPAPRAQSLLLAMWVRSGFWLSPQLAGTLALRLLPPGASAQPDPIADAAPAAAAPRPAAPAAAPGGLRESAGAERAGAAEARGGEGAGRGRGAPAEARGVARHAPEGGPSTSGGAGDADDVVLGLRLLQGRVRSSPSPILGPHSLGVLQASSEAAHRSVFKSSAQAIPS